MKIKNSLLMFALATVLSLASFTSHAQLQKGDVLLNAGLGFGYYYAGGVSFNFNGEYSITDELAVGPYIAYTRWDYGYLGYNSSYNFIDFGARGSYHFSKLFKINVEELDIYGGAFLGFVVSSYDYDGVDYDDPYDSGIRAGIHAGARYFFSDKFAGYGEVGIGLSPLVLGVTFKL